MKRRDLLKAVIAGPLVVTGCGGGSGSPGGAQAASPGPAPIPSTLPAPVSTPASPTLPPPLPIPGAIQLTLAIPVAGEHPFTIGQVFAKGHIPNGTAITSNIPRFQADVRNKWPDGSVRFAVLSGIASAGTVSIVKGGAPFAGPDVAEPDVEATVAFTNVTDASGAVVVGGTWAASLASARANGSKAWSRTTAHKVRQILGPVMSEFHYFVPTPDAHTYVWFYVRAYVTGQVEVETVVENGWFMVPAPGRRNYDVAVAIGGTQRFSASGLVHYHHTRWSRVDWVGADPQVTPKHDIAYLQLIDGMPALAVSSLNSTAYSTKPDGGPKYSAYTRALGEQPLPFSSANIDPALGAGGYSDNVNLFAPWDMTYLAEGNAGAYWAIQANARAAGRFSLHYRDENTGGIVRGSVRTGINLNNAQVGIADNAGNGATTTPPPAGGYMQQWYYTHGPSLGYFAYLTSGRWTAMEECGFIASTADFLTSTAYVHNGFRILRYTGQLREIAWMFRTKAQAALCVPEFLMGSAVSGETVNQRAEAVGRFDATVDWWHATMVANTPTNPFANTRPRIFANNVFGLWYNTTDQDATANNQWGVSGMMTYYLAASVLWAAVAEATSNANLTSLAVFTARWPVGMLGAAPGSTLWDWRCHTFYNLPFGEGGEPNYDIAPRASWDAQWTWLTTNISWQTNPTALPANNSLYRMGNASVSPVGMTALSSINNTASDVDAAAAAIAFLSDLARKAPVSGAANAIARYYGSDTWQASVNTTFRSSPTYAYGSKKT